MVQHVKQRSLPEILATDETLRRTRFLECIRDVYRDDENVIAKEGDIGDLGRLRVSVLTWEHCSTTFDTGVLRPPCVHENDHRFAVNQGEAQNRRKGNPAS